MLKDIANYLLTGFIWLPLVLMSILLVVIFIQLVWTQMGWFGVILILWLAALLFYIIKGGF